MLTTKKNARWGGTAISKSNSRFHSRLASAKPWLLHRCGPVKLFQPPGLLMKTCVESAFSCGFDATNVIWWCP